ncbi:hypothetical protein L208DRAFT_1379667 [Tricholoma matsutake]|nr:hypothetical protein L208DRAFT_1379667 [Tricholoma matsutake 945]
MPKRLSKVFSSMLGAHLHIAVGHPPIGACSFGLGSLNLPSCKRINAHREDKMCFDGPRKGFLDMFAQARVKTPRPPPSFLGWSYNWFRAVFNGFSVSIAVSGAQEAANGRRYNDHPTACVGGIRNLLLSNVTVLDARKVDNG